MSRSIPSLKMLTSMLSGVLEKSRNIPGGVHGEDAVKHNLKQLRDGSSLLGSRARSSRTTRALLKHETRPTPRLRSCVSQTRSAWTTR
jgi:hypothetical protein